MPERLCQLPGCGRAIPSRKRKDARWCSRSCESKARRQAARKARFEAANPQTVQLIGAEDQSLAELHQRAGRPDHWADIEAGPADDELLEHTDYFDIGIYGHNHQDDEQGIHSGDSAPDPWQQRNEAWAAQMAHTEAVEQIRARYERLLAPYRETMKRNVGVKPVAVARLEQVRDAEIQELTRARQQAQAAEWAGRDRQGRIATAHERQLERAAARSFAIDLGRGRHLRDDPGRATQDIARG
jgi:hypothetical protein